jgi:hypothetical protein
MSGGPCRWRVENVQTALLIAVLTVPAENDHNLSLLPVLPFFMLRT